MRASKRLLRAAAEFAVVLALLLAPWPGLDRAFSAAFGRCFNVLGFERRFASGMSMRLQSPSEADGQTLGARAGWHVMLRVANESNGKATRLGFNTRTTTYVPLSAFLAFALVARVWRRRRAYLGVLSGALLTFTFSLLALTLASLRFLSLGRVGALSFARDTNALLDSLFLGWIVPPGMAFAVPLLAGCLMLWLSPAHANAQVRA